MKATLFGIGILLLAAGTCTPVRADYPYYNNTWYGPTLPQAPDMCGTGWYCANACGVVYGPNHYVYPPFPPYSGIAPRVPTGPSFPTHPFARSPRDFFMIGD
jgi:hypothetical protein